MEIPLNLSLLSFQTEAGTARSMSVGVADSLDLFDCDVTDM